ncbi:glycosyltransferase [Clostridium gasigenes]|uniref:Glycosyltransferase involved in cell wall bisynthesis n=1 Tax=Clostridium gasigenes TaxID=94869 RepID=A0A1H0THJ6_9CLOT|nr:glycosyltransferase [Clostridium gasigenes]SDP53315.1 Glycosyltransferase involved in cell wall bisynthesis [Clostridium gasigenes]
MHILVIPSAYPTEDVPLRSSFFKEQTIAVKKSGKKIGLIYSETRRVTGINKSTIVKNHFQITDNCEDEINTIRLHGWNILLMRNSFGVNLWVRQSIKLFKIYIKKYGLPDIIHVHCGLYGGLVGKYIKEEYNIPYIITEHLSIVMNHKMDNYHKNILREAYNSASALISVGSKLKKSMEVYTKVNIVVIPNIVNTSVFNYVKSDMPRNFKFISVSNLKLDKRVNLTIEAFSSEFKGEDVELIIIGDGPERNNLKMLCNKLEVENQVKFIGAIKRDIINEYLNKSSAFVLPSSFETFGVVYIEALACGLPIIATKCGGPEDFFEKYMGYLIEVDNVEALCKSMRSMIENYSDFNKEKISNYIKERFSEDVVVKKIDNIYREVLNNKIM